MMHEHTSPIATRADRAIWGFLMSSLVGAHMEILAGEREMLVTLITLISFFGCALVGAVFFSREIGRGLSEERRKALEECLLENFLLMQALVLVMILAIFLVLRPDMPISAGGTFTLVLGAGLLALREMWRQPAA